MPWTDLIWYGVEFTTYICIIAYTAYTFGILKPMRFKNESPATFGETWKNANAFLGRATEVAAKLQSTFDGAAVPSGAPPAAAQQSEAKVARK